MSSVTALRTDSFSDDLLESPQARLEARFEERPAQKNELSRAYAAFQLSYWRCRSVIQDLKIEISATNAAAFEGVEDLAHLQLTLGSDALEIIAPIALLDAFLSRAPEPETLSQLSAEDAALMLEHVLTPGLEKLEAEMGMIFQIHTIQRSTSFSLSEWPVKLLCKAQGKKFPFAASFTSHKIAKAFAETIEEIEALGPPIKVGYALQIGPVFLSEDEISSLAEGDELLLGVPSFEGLSGLVEFNETHCWPIKLVEGKIEFIDSLMPVEAVIPADDATLPLFYQLGVTAEEGPVTIGRKVPLARIEEKRMMIRHGKRDIAGAKLVKVTDGVALRITNLTGE